MTDLFGKNPRQFDSSKKFFSASVPPNRTFTLRSVKCKFSLFNVWSRAASVPLPFSLSTTGRRGNSFSWYSFLPARSLLELQTAITLSVRKGREFMNFDLIG